MKRVRITISGQVQGVWYRKNAQAKAQELGLNGWVKNTSNGHVLAEAQGENAALQQFITWCYQGPEAAIVTGVETENIATEECFSFDIHR